MTLVPDITIEDVGGSSLERNIGGFLRFAVNSYV